jgi:hypothetical protein
MTEKEIKDKENKYCLYSPEKGMYYCGSCSRVKWHRNINRARFADHARHLDELIFQYGDYKILKDCIIIEFEKGSKLCEMSVFDFVDKIKEKLHRENVTTLNRIDK